ncbi:hypothetical protein D3C83_290180 [compost metagenome]
MREVGIKQIEEADYAFKTTMDPYNLLNPGKIDFSVAAAQVASNLPTSGWSFRNRD